MKDNKLFPILLISVCTILAIFNGIGNFFKVDQYTIYLLLIAIVPTILKNIISIKFGDWEARFADQPFEQKMFTFLIAAAKQKKLTYYPPRKDEEQLFEAIRTLAIVVKTNYPEKFVKTLTHHLKTDEPNLIWFASENIGYFRIDMLKDKLKKHFENLLSCPLQDFEWAPHILNCLWAYSRFYKNYEPLQGLLLKTNNVNNILWIINAYEQMPTLHPEDKEIVLTNLNRFNENLEKIEGMVEIEKEKIKKIIATAIDKITLLPG